MSQARNNALLAAVARFARACRLGGAYDHLPTAELHAATEHVAMDTAAKMSRTRNSRQITNILNTATANAGQEEERLDNRRQNL